MRLKADEDAAKFISSEIFHEGKLLAGLR